VARALAKPLEPPLIRKTLTKIPRLGISKGLSINGQLTLAPYSEFSRASTEEKAHEEKEVSKMMLENGSGEQEGLLVRAEPLELAEELSHKMMVQKGE
jgi:hypothetical protein